MKPINSQIYRILREHKNIAVVGLSDNPMRSSNGIASLMVAEGYNVIPVNPRYETVFGKKS